MTDKELTLDELTEQVAQLSPMERLQLMERIAATLKQDLKDVDPKPLKSLYGFLAHLGPGPSDEDIDEMRREMWSNFPREDIL